VLIRGKGRVHGPTRKPCPKVMETLARGFELPWRHSRTQFLYQQLLHTKKKGKTGGKAARGRPARNRADTYGKREAKCGEWDHAKFQRSGETPLILCQRMNLAPERSAERPSWRRSSAYIGWWGLRIRYYQQGGSWFLMQASPEGKRQDNAEGAILHGSLCHAPISEG